MIREGAVLRAVKLDVTDIHRGFPLDMVRPDYLVNQILCRCDSVGNARYTRGEGCCDDHEVTAIVVIIPISWSGLACGLLARVSFERSCRMAIRSMSSSDRSMSLWAYRLVVA